MACWFTRTSCILCGISGCANTGAISTLWKHGRGRNPTELGGITFCTIAAGPGSGMKRISAAAESKRCTWTWKYGPGWPRSRGSKPRGALCSPRENERGCRAKLRRKRAFRSPSSTPDDKAKLIFCFRVFRIFLSVFLGAALAAFGADDTPTQTTASWRGVLRDASGQRVSGARIELRGTGHDALSATTAADGAFAFDAVQPGSYSLRVAWDKGDA